MASSVGYIISSCFLDLSYW